MQFRVLGSTGCIGGKELSSAYLVDQSILIDAGTGLGSLGQQALEKIDHVFLSHSHMDHIALLPLLADATLESRRQPITVHATEPTLDALSRHIFNWRIAPDFRVLPSRDQPTLRFSPLQAGTPVQVDGCTITAIPVDHSIPTVAFHVDGGNGSLVLASDTGVSDGLWPVVNGIANLRYLLIEAAFENARIDLCRTSGHLCPSLLEQELKRFHGPGDVCIVHVKPTAMAKVRQEVAAFDMDQTPRFLQDGDILEF